MTKTRYNINLVIEHDGASVVGPYEKQQLVQHFIEDVGNGTVMPCGDSYVSSITVDEEPLS